MKDWWKHACRDAMFAFFALLGFGAILAIGKLLGIQWEVVAIGVYLLIGIFWPMGKSKS